MPMQHRRLWIVLGADIAYLGAVQHGVQPPPLDRAQDPVHALPGVLPDDGGTAAASGAGSSAGGAAAARGSGGTSCRVPNDSLSRKSDSSGGSRTGSGDGAAPVLGGGGRQYPGSSGDCQGPVNVRS